MRSGLGNEWVLVKTEQQLYEEASGAHAAALTERREVHVHLQRRNGSCVPHARSGVPSNRIGALISSGSRAVPAAFDLLPEATKRNKDACRLLI